MLVTAVDVVDDPSDRLQLGGMMEKAEETLGQRAETTLADAGYHSGSSLEECAQRGQPVADARVPGPGPGESLSTRIASSTTRPTTATAAPRDNYCASPASRRTRNTMMRLYRGSGALCRACPAFGVCTTDRHHGRALEVGPPRRSIASSPGLDAHGGSQPSVQT